MKPTFTTIEKRVASLESARRPTTPPATLERALAALAALRARVESGAHVSADELARLARIDELEVLARARRDKALQSPTDAPVTA